MDDIIVQLNPAYALTDSLLEVRTNHAVAEAEQDANDTLTTQLPELSRAIQMQGPLEPRLEAMRKLATATQSMASSQDVTILAEFEPTHVLDHIVAMCSEEALIQSVQVVGTGLSVLGNVAYLGALDLVVSARAPALYVHLLCSENSPPQIVGYAAAALGVPSQQ